MRRGRARGQNAALPISASLRLAAACTPGHAGLDLSTAEEWPLSREQKGPSRAAIRVFLSILLAWLGGVAPVHAQSTGVAPSVATDPSVRSSGLGGASGAVAWGDDLDAWANPALLGFHDGLRFEWSETPIRTTYLNAEQLTSQRWTLGYGGLGLCLGGVPLSTLGRSRLDGPVLLGMDESGSFLGYFTYAESVETFAAGVSLLHAAGTLGDLTRWFRMPEFAQYGELSLGYGGKKLTSSSMPGRVKLRDLGALIRITPYNSIETGGGWSGLDRRIGLRVDISHGRSTQNGGGGAIFSWDSLRVASVPELTRHSWAARLVISVPRERDRALRQGRLGWVFDFVSPTLSVGGGRDQVEPSRRRVGGAISHGEVAHRSGWEISVGNVISWRGGRIDDPDAGVKGSSRGWSAGIQCRGLGGFRVDRSTVPRANSRGRIRQEAFTAFVDPVGIWRRLR